MALTFLVGALPFLFIASAHAQEMSQTQEVYAQETQIQEAEKKTSQTNPWLDDYNTPVGLTYGFTATLQTTWICSTEHRSATAQRLESSQAFRAYVTRRFHV